MATKVTWRQLRQAAESAQGLQAKHVGIRLDSSNSLVVEVYNTTHSSKYLFELDPLPNHKPGTLAVKLPGIKTDELPFPVPGDDFFSVADAVFWSMAAVEKFLLPYYSSIHELETVMTKVRDRFKDQSVLAFIHLPNSEIIDGGGLLVNLFAVQPLDPNTEGGPYQLTPVL